ncbi:MAG TPA: hypothetical protein VE978_24265 [Chitinophagales bacterium]|nr:hypothetical protein [Chitinophagales bacterium]
MKKFLLLLLLITAWASNAFSQNDEKEGPRIFGASKMLLTGNAQASFVMDSANVNFGELAFKPIFLWSLSDKLFIESEVEIETSEEGPELVLEFVNMCYKITPYTTLHFGRFLPKFGMYRGRLGEAFVNRFGTDPVGFGDGGIGPMVEEGIGVEGGIPLGSAKMNYDIWVSDGPQLIEGGDDAGQFEYEAYTDNNKNKAIGGRIGVLPFSNSSLELGFSYEMADKTGGTSSDVESVGVQMMAVDANFFHTISPLKSTVRILGEWKNQMVDDAFYPDIEDSINDNNSSALYGVVALRPSLVDSKVLRNLEVAFRYSSFMRPEGGWGGKDLTQTAVALDYWLKWNCVAKLMWQHQTDELDQFIFQLVYGF